MAIEGAEWAGGEGFEPNGAAQSFASVSVIICAYTFDRLRDVLEAIESIERQDLAAREIIVVVDHNPPLLKAIEEQARGRVSLVENQFDRGLSGARNTGIAAAKGTLVFFLDDDAIAAPSCLRRLADRCVEPDVIGAGALIEPVWPGAPPSWFPGEFLWVVGCTYAGLAPGKTRNLLGAAMCMRREVFDKTGGFDGGLGRRSANLPFGCEETELCIRATREIAGSYFVFEPAAQAAHKVSPDRVSWSYFAKRCYAEGLSKAHLTHLVGASSSLESEGHYVRQTLARAIMRNIADVFLRRQPSGLARIAAIMTGLGSAGAGFALGRLKAKPQDDAAPKAAPSPAGGQAHLSNLAPATTAAPEEDGALLQASSLLTKIRTKLGPHLSLFSNAGLLGLGTGVASVFGFLYWWLAARTFPAAAVGYAAAAISLMNFLGHVGETGLGALVMGDVHRFKDRAGALISGALLVSAGCSAFFGLLYLSISAVFPVALGDIGSDWGSVVFVLGCGLTGLTIVLDQAMVGTMQSQLQLLRNTAFSFVKLALLAIATLLTAVFALHETTILDTWIIGQIVSMILLAVIARKRMKSVLGPPDIGLLRPLLKNVLGHHGLNLANLAPSLLMPFVVTVVLTPSVNAAFYAAWTVINVAYLVPASLATVVFTVGAKDPAGLSSKLRMSLGASLACGLGVAIVCFFGSNLILSMFSPAYARVAGLSFSLLGLSIFPIAIKYHYVSIQRLRNRMVSASLLAVLGCALELAGAIVGGLKGDLLGLTLGWLIGLSIEAAVMMPVVLAALPPVAGMMRWSGGRSGALAVFGLATASSEDRG